MSTDALRKHDLKVAKSLTLEEKARQAFEVMEFGIRLQEAKFRASGKYATEEELHQAMLDWLCAER